ncbi:MAG: flagellar hook protein FlgE [Synergistales bacterium]|nr:flagellar hook protein FlgE [Synergistales bacterium]
MLRSLMAGVSAVRGHQTYLDVVGNNIANVNTVGFKKSNLIFQDLLYQTSRGASAPQGQLGGVNPMQVGLGSRVGAIETIHTQGNLQYTGNRNDMAIQGDGYYVLSNQGKTIYSRAGAFNLDGEGNLVQSGTGYMLQGYELSVDPLDPTRYVQGSTLEAINIPVGQKLEPRATTLAGFRCNLNSQVPPYLPMGVLTNDVKIGFSLDNGTDQVAYSLDVEAGETPADFMTLTDGTNSVTLALSGINAESGLPEFTVTPGGDFTSATYDPLTGRLTLSNGGTDTKTLELAEYMNFTRFSHGDPKVQYLAEFNDLPNGDRQMVLWDGAGNRETLDLVMNSDGTFAPADPAPTIAIGGVTFTVDFAASGLSLTLKDVDTDVVSLRQAISSVHTTKLDVYDTLGNAHTLELSWEKIDNNQWRWRAWLPDEPGITLTNSTGILDFTTDGQLVGPDTADLGLNFAAIGATDAVITLDFAGTSFGNEPIEGVTQFGEAFTTKAFYQDGFGMGVLEDYAVGEDGIVQGVYSNGQTRSLSRVALALFANPQGLVKVGDTAFETSANSGLPQIVSPTEGGAGKISGGNLEMSNVDLSEEFVRLIVAQRGFQANARVITTSDDVLQELINMKR